MKLKSKLAAVLSLVATLAAAQAGAEQWVRKNGAPDPYVRGIRVFSNTPATGQTTVYASTLAKGVIKVVDTGTSQTATPMNNGLPVLRIRVVNGQSASNLYVGIDSHGIYKTTDGGANWVAANGTGASALGCREVRNIGARTDAEVWAVTGCLHNSGVYRTTDGGATWSRVGASFIPDDATVGSITFSGTGVTTIVVISTSRYGMFRSADNGATWTQINTGLPAPNGPNNISVFNTIFVGTSTTQMLAYVEGQGIFRTIDSGANWSAYGTGLPSTAHALGGILRRNNTTYYVGTDKGPVYRTTDSGATWSAWGNTGTDDVGRFVRSVSADASGRTYLSGHIGLGRTVDDGSTFTYIDIGQGYVSDMILDPDGKTFYVASQSLFRIPDLYAPFGPNNEGTDIGTGLPGGLVGADIAQDKTQPSTFFAGLTNFGLYKTTNGGANWSRLNLPNVEVGAGPVASISPSNGQVVYAWPQNKYGKDTGGGLFKSVDGGSTWADSSTGLITPDARNVNSMAQHQDAPSALVIATGDGLYRSTDAGANWVLVKQVIDDQSTRLPFGSVRFHPFDPTILYAAATHANSDGTLRASSGVYKSTDGGATWTQVLSGKRASSVRVEGSGRVVVMFSRDLSQPALLASSDGGTTWVTFNNGIEDNDGVTLVSSIREQGSKVVFASMTTGIYVLDQRPPRLANISTRGRVLTGNDVMIGGFVIGGSASKTVLVRARGPSMIPAGVTDALADPTMTLVNQATTAIIGTNDNWGSASNSSAVTATGLAPTDALESAILTTLAPGAYTVVVSGVNNGVGVGIVEVFEIDHPEIPLANISTRGQVQTGNNVMIGGFVISGTAPQQVLIRARGPSMIPAGVANALADPTMTLVDQATSTILATNDNWGTASNASAITTTGLAPTNPFESAILTTLAPGAYTVVVSGVNNGTGVGIVEVFAQ